MNIYYNSSDIAALINKNPYKTQDESIHNLLCKINKIENTTEIDKFNKLNKNDSINLLNNFYNTKKLSDTDFELYKNQINNLSNQYDLNKFNKSIIEHISKEYINTSNTKDCIKQQNEFNDNLDKIITKDNTLIKEYMNSYINKNRGIKNENKIIKEYSKKNNTNITNNNSKLYKHKLFSIDKYNFFLCGKIDGIENDELIEIKNRKNRLFYNIPEYEQIQVQCYFILTNLKKGKLIENYNDTQNIIITENNINLSNYIIEELKNVSNIIISKLN